MTHAGNSFDSDYARLATKNPASKVHTHMRQLAHVLALLSEQDEWPTLLTTCGAPLGALSHWFHGALEYLTTSWNLHGRQAWIEARLLTVASAIADASRG